MTDERRSPQTREERRIRDAIRSTGEVRADPAFREQLKRRFVAGTFDGAAAGPRGAGVERKFRWGWVLIPVAAAVTLLVLFVPGSPPAWVVNADGEGELEIAGRTLTSADTELAARELSSGGRVRLSEGLAIDLRLDDLLILELDEGSEVTVPAPAQRGTRSPLISEVHAGELRIKTGPGFPGNELHVLTAEGRTEISGTTVSVYKGDGYTCVCVLEGTARVGVDESSLEDVPAGMLKILFAEEGEALVTDISPEHEANLVEFGKRFADAFTQRD